MNSGIQYRQIWGAYLDPYRVYLPPAKFMLFTLIGCFLIVSPLSISGSTSREGDDILKWARVLNLGLLTLIGLQFLRVPRQADISGRLLLFGLVFWLAALWSDSVLWGIAFKSMFFASLLAGVAIGNAIQTEQEFRGFARLLTVVSTISSLLLVYAAATSTESLFWNGRLQIWDINSNLLAQSAAVFAVLSMFHVAIRDRPIWIVLALIQVFSMVSICIFTGSRGAVLMIAAGICVFLPTLTTKLRTLIIASAIAAIGIALISYSWNQVEETSVNSNDAVSGELRIIAEATRDTRFAMWEYYVRKAMRTPWFGVGWLHRGTSWSTVQSAYLQVFVECGLVGILILAAFLLGVLQRGVALARFAWGHRDFRSINIYVIIATLCALLFHGVFESSAVTGASPIAILIAFCCTRLDGYWWEIRAFSPSRHYLEQRFVLQRPLEGH